MVRKRYWDLWKGGRGNDWRRRKGIKDEKDYIYEGFGKDIDGERWKRWIKRNVWKGEKEFWKYKGGKKEEDLNRWNVYRIKKEKGRGRMGKKWRMDLIRK